jgi:hypothetical protein
MAISRATVAQLRAVPAVWPLVRASCAHALRACFTREGVVRDHLGKACAGEHHDGGVDGEAAGDLLL